MPLEYVSVCSGIEAATVAFHPLGWRPLAFAENESFPSAVLAHHYPDVPNLGDITRFQEWPDARFDLLVGGTPCQAFSIAGLRRGFADARGNLTLTYCAILARYRPCWFLWENVPGVLSVDGGRAFGSFLGAMAELGYGFSYRVLDAQHFGVPQQRKRVYVVGHLGDWRRPVAVLFEPESVPRISSPTANYGKPEWWAGKGRILNCIDASYGEKWGSNQWYARRHVIVGGDKRPRRLSPLEVERCFGFPDGYTDLYELRRTAQNRQAETRQTPETWSSGLVQPVLREGSTANQKLTGERANKTCLEQGFSVQSNEPASGGYARRAAAPLRDLQGGSIEALPHRSRPYDGRRSRYSMSRMQPQTTNGRGCFQTSNGPQVSSKTQIARTPDNPRYRALGNSMVVNVVRWIGRRIEMVRTAVGDHA